jgi:hypothetical protein
MKRDVFVYVNLKADTPGHLEGKYRGRSVSFQYRGQPWEVYVFDERTVSCWTTFQYLRKVHLC